MGIFNLFHPQKAVSPEAQKWELMWNLWESGQAASPYQQLMTYQAEVNNGGHAQFFFNANNTGDLDAAAAEVLRILPEPLTQNLQTAFRIYTQHKNTDEEHMDSILADCDRLFYKSQEQIDLLLKEYANTLRL